jgi:hypothetical protein
MASCQFLLMSHVNVRKPKLKIPLVQFYLNEKLLKMNKYFVKKIILKE